MMLLTMTDIEIYINICGHNVPFDFIYVLGHLIALTALFHSGFQPSHPLVCANA